MQHKATVSMLCAQCFPHDSSSVLVFVICVTVIVYISVRVAIAFRRRSGHFAPTEEERRKIKLHVKPFIVAECCHCTSVPPFFFVIFKTWFFDCCASLPP